MTQIKTPSRPITQPGLCPEVNNPLDECPPPKSEKHGCLIDSDCGSNYKCCSDGCNLICTNPITHGQSLKKGKSWN